MTLITVRRPVRRRPWELTGLLLRVVVDSEVRARIAWKEEDATFDVAPGLHYFEANQGFYLTYSFSNVLPLQCGATPIELLVRRRSHRRLGIDPELEILVMTGDQ